VPKPYEFDQLARTLADLDRPLTASAARVAP